MNRLLQATGIIAAAGITWAAGQKLYDNYQARTDTQSRLEERLGAQATIDETLLQLWACLDENMNHPDDIYGLNGMYWRGLRECIPLYSVFKSYPFVFNTSAARGEFDTIMNNNPLFFERFRSDIELLKDETLLTRLQMFRSHMTLPTGINNPYDIENDPEGFCEIAYCNPEHIRSWFTGDEERSNFDWLYMIVNEEYTTAYNLVGMLERNGMEYDHFASFIEWLLATEEN